MPQPWKTRVRTVRRRAGLTQCDLARLCDVHPQTVARWESGSRAPHGLRAAVIVAIEALPAPAGAGLAQAPLPVALRRLFA